MKTLVTGAAGFIGFHTALRLIERGDEVVGLDNLNDYYDVNLKFARLAELDKHHHFRFEKLDLADRENMAALFAREGFRRVIHLGAQAGVRYSLTNPQVYIDSNLVGFGHILEGCRQTAVEHLTYASSSSVYGLNTELPFAVQHNVDHPISLYAATKKANELMAHTYSHLYGLPTTGLRFFTVYGPWGRPDMALFKFTQAILSNEAIEVYNNGDMERDFTYIDDIVEGVVRTSDQIAQPDPKWNAAAPDPSRSSAPYRLYNIGNHQPVPLLQMIAVLEDALGRKAEKRLLPLQAGDVRKTCAEISALQQAVGFAPDTPIEDGIPRFVEWYRAHYGI